jgi:AraC-like DNA-binding protein
MSLETGGLTHASTHAARATDKVPLWNGMVRQHLIALDCTPSRPGSFDGMIASRRIGQVQLLQLQAAAQCMRRSADALAQAGPEVFLLNVQREGISSVAQDGREVALLPGDAALYSSARSCEIRYGDMFHQTVLVLPAETLRASLPDIDKLTATLFQRDEPATRMLAGLAALYFQLPLETIGSTARAHAGKALTEAVTASLAAASTEADMALPKLSRFHLGRIKQFLSTNLHDSDLSVQMVAGALHISPAHIHRLFASEKNTFSAWMWQQRLLTCRLSLEDPTMAHLPISHIAFSSGFNSSSHFSRVFRARYGATPRQWRDRRLP